MADSEVRTGVLSVDLARAIANPWRAKILASLAVKPISPSEFAREADVEVGFAARHFRQLAEWRLIEVVETKSGGRRRGGVEHVYRTIRRAKLDTSAWRDLPDYLREDISANAIETLIARISDAVNEGTMDAELDRQLSWDILSLDRAAWEEVMEKMDEFLDWLPELQAEALLRMSKTGEAPMPTTVGLLGFRSPSS